MGGFKRKIPPKRRFSSIVVVAGDVRDFVERNIIIVVFVFEKIVAEIHIDIIIVQNDVVIVLHRFFRLCCRGIFGVGGNHARLGVVYFDHLARIRADDRILVQVVKPFTRCRANALCTPFFFGHWRPLEIASGHIDDSGRLPYDVGTVKAFEHIRGAILGKHHLPGVPGVPIVMRRSARARRITLRISQLDGRVTLTLPNGTPESEALDFARQKQDWILGHLDRREEDVSVAPGVSLPVDGTPREILQIKGRRILLQDETLGVPEGPVGPRLQAWLKVRARDRLAAACDGYAKQLGRPYARLVLRDTRSRWGSCTSEGNLMFSWRLILAPAEVLDYVAAHEVAHLAEMNHSPAFWSVVENLYGPYAAPRAWLRSEGNKLHRYRFDSDS